MGLYYYYYYYCCCYGCYYQYYYYHHYYYFYYYHHRHHYNYLHMIYLILFCHINSYYWAPWMASLLIAEGEEHKLPYEIVFSSFIVASMLGNYLFQMFSAQSPVLGSGSPNIGGAFQVAFMYLLDSF